MKPERLNAAVQRELALLVNQGLVDPAKKHLIERQYPVSGWDLHALSKTLLLMGALATGGGILLFLYEKMSGYLLLELLFGGLMAALFGLARLPVVKTRFASLPRILELIGCFAATALTLTLGAHFSTGSGNWPALIGIDTVLFVITAYVVNNRLVLIYAVANCFLWFGGSTGYVSGWGMYWLGMTYPLRFLVAGAVSVSLGYFHEALEAQPFLERFRNFGRVYFHYGLLVFNLALWFFSLFGYYTDKDFRWDDTQGERLLFTLLWMVASGISVFVGSRTLRTHLRTYGIVFFTINLYTAYFQFIAAHSGELWFLHALLVGGSMIALGFIMERRLRKARDASAAGPTP